MSDNDCYGGQHFPLVAVDQIRSHRYLGDQLQLSLGICWDILVTSSRCFGMLRCSGGQTSHQVYQGQMYFDQGHKSSACGGDQVDSHVNGQVGDPIQLSGGDVFAQLDVLEVVEVVVVAFAVVLVVAVVVVVQFWVEGLSLHYQGSNLLTGT